MMCITGFDELLKVNKLKAAAVPTRRVIGFWIAAIRLLMGGLAARMRTG